MTVDQCSVCGSRMDEYASGGGPNNARCQDCRFEKPPTPGTIEYKELHEDDG